MKLFQPIDGSAVILYSKGMYRQVEVSLRDGEVYAKQGSGWIALLNSGNTSYGDVKWSDLSLPHRFELGSERTGRVKATDRQAED